jgi:hypothetical protein
MYEVIQHGESEKGRITNINADVVDVLIYIPSSFFKKKNNISTIMLKIQSWIGLRQVLVSSSKRKIWIFVMILKFSTILNLLRII